MASLAMRLACRLRNMKHNAGQQSTVLNSKSRLRRALGRKIPQHIPHEAAHPFSIDRVVRHAKPAASSKLVPQQGRKLITTSGAKAKALYGEIRRGHFNAKEFFSGSKHLSRSLIARGISTASIDILEGGPDHDLGKPTVMDRFKNSADKDDYHHYAPPCSSYSSATWPKLRYRIMIIASVTGHHRELQPRGGCNILAKRGQHKYVSTTAQLVLSSAWMQVVLLSIGSPSAAL